jgi:hypothetical protein
MASYRDSFTVTSSAIMETACVMKARNVVFCKCGNGFQFTVRGLFYDAGVVRF